VNTLPLNAKRNGATLIEMNPEPTIFNNLMDFSLRGKATETLPKILSMIKNV
jgi:NAD-dependent deacetylase